MNKRGRPQKYPLTANQEKSIRSKINKGMSNPEIQRSLNKPVHAFAILRVRRAAKKGN